MPGEPIPPPDNLRPVDPNALGVPKAPPEEITPVTPNISGPDKPGQQTAGHESVLESKDTERSPINNEKIDMWKKEFVNLSIKELKIAFDQNVARYQQEKQEKGTPNDSGGEQYLALFHLLQEKYIKTLEKLPLAELQRILRQKQEESKISRGDKYSRAEECIRDALVIEIVRRNDDRQTKKCYKVYQNIPPEQIRELLHELPEQTAIDGEIIDKGVQYRVLEELYKQKMSEKI